MCTYVFVYTYIYIYIYTHIQRERERERWCHCEFHVSFLTEGPSAAFAAKYYTPEISEVEFHWNMQLKVHWGIPVTTALGK